LFPRRCAWPALLAGAFEAAGLGSLDVRNLAVPASNIMLMREHLLAYDFGTWAPDLVLVATSANDDFEGSAKHPTGKTWANLADASAAFLRDVGDRVAACGGGRPAFVGAGNGGPRRTFQEYLAIVCSGRKHPYFARP